MPIFVFDQSSWVNEKWCIRWNCYSSGWRHLPNRGAIRWIVWHVDTILRRLRFFHIASFYCSAKVFLLFINNMLCQMIFWFMQISYFRYRAILGPFQLSVWLLLCFAYVILIIPLSFNSHYTILSLIKHPSGMNNIFWFIFSTFTNSFVVKSPLLDYGMAKNSISMLIGMGKYNMNRACMKRHGCRFIYLFGSCQVTKYQVHYWCTSTSRGH